MANPRARSLRRFMTGAERCLWTHLRGRQIDRHRFRRQHPIWPFIVDFVCLDRRVVVEVYGGHHGDETSHDRERAWFLDQQGFRVIRFWNDDVLRSIEAVVEMIASFLAETPPPQPSPALRAGEGEEESSSG